MTTDGSLESKGTVVNPATLHQPFLYLKKLRDHFKDRKKTWQWFSDEGNKELQINEFKSELLKNTYRLEHEDHLNLYTICKEVCESLAIDADVTLYQENNSLQLNAGISIIDQEAHIVLSGNVLNILSEEEFRTLMGHELSHYLYFKIDNGDYEIMHRIVLSLANDPRSEGAVIETARIAQLYMELFCDLGALRASSDFRIAIQTLVKMNTGLNEVSADSYLKQAEEIITADNSASHNGSHPESYIRSVAIKLANEQSDEFELRIKKMIEGPLDMDRLDIFDQITLQGLTQKLLQSLVTPAWMYSAAVQNLCKEYFDNFSRDGSQNYISELKETLSTANDSVKTYFCYVLLDFTKVDPGLEQNPMGFTLELAELLELSEVYETLIRKTLKLTVRDFKQLKNQALKELQQVKESKTDSLYDE